MSNTTPPGLMSKLLGLAVTFLVVVVILWLALVLLAQIWFWLLVVACVIVLGAVALRVLRSRRSRW